MSVLKPSVFKGRTEAAPAEPEAYPDPIIEWARPSDWLQMPDIPVGEQKIQILYPVFAGMPAPQRIFYLGSTGLVDWGDGSAVEQVASGTWNTHAYDYDTLPESSFCSRGYKQVLITITNTEGFNLDGGFLLSAYESERLALDIVARVPYVTQINYFQSSFLLERINFYEIGLNTLSNAFTGCVKLAVVESLGAGPFNSLYSAFSGCRSLISLPELNTSNCSQYQNAFDQCNSLRILPPLTIGHPSAVMANMFKDCNSITEITLRNTQSVTTFANAFSQCYGVKKITFDGGTGSATNFSSAFESCYALEEIIGLDTSNATNLGSMFYDCKNLLNIPALNTSKVTSFYGTFTGCYRLMEGPDLDTSKATSMASMFSNCFALRQIPLYDASLVTSMSQMFSNCKDLRKVPLLNTASCTVFSAMFANCAALQEVPLLDTSNGTAFDSMFSNCPALRELPLLNTSKGTTFAAMLYACSALTHIPALDIGVATNVNSFIPTDSNSALTRVLVAPIKLSLNVGSKLRRAALVEIFNNLAIAVGQTLTISNCPGATALTETERAIATNKGWTITG